MRYFIMLLFTAITIHNHAISQQLPPRMIISSGIGKSCTVGGVMVGYSSGIPNRLWQGFWIPKNVTSSINEEISTDSKNSIVMPNPATTHVTISTKTDVEYISLYTNMGEFIYSTQETTITVATLIPNMYIVRVIYKDNTIDTHKLIVSH